MADDDDDFDDDFDDDDFDEGDLDDVGGEDGPSGDEDFDGEGGPAPGGKKKLMLLIVIVLLLILGGLGAAFFLGVFDDETIEEEVVDEEGQVKTIVTLPTLDIPAMVVNLNTKGKKPTFFQLKLKLEIQDGIPDEIQQEFIPRVMDTFYFYLRAMDTKDIEGSAGMERMRKGLLRRARAVFAPVEVHDVLFERIIIDKKG